jgi:hypothetical protein
MALSAGEQRILKEIEHDLAAAEPRLERALVAARLPMLQRRSVVTSGAKQRSQRAWIAGMCGLLLSGIALLTIGPVMHIVVLTWIGAPLAQFSPVAVGYLCKRAHRSSLGKPATPAPGYGRGDNTENTERR